jgi:hypothetical protein
MANEIKAKTDNAKKYKQEVLSKGPKNIDIKSDIL